MIRKADLEQAIDVGLHRIQCYCAGCDEFLDVFEFSWTGDLVGDVTDIVIAQLKGKGYEVEE